MVESEPRGIDRALSILSEKLGSATQDVGDFFVEAAIEASEGWEKRLAKAINENKPIKSTSKYYIRATEYIEANGCLRYLFQTYYRLLPEPEFSKDTLRIFDNGKMVHYRWQAYFLGMPNEWNVQVAVRKSRSLLTGEADAIIDHAQYGKWIIEIKSINTFQFKSLVSPLEKHLDQALVYNWIFRADGVIILYEDKNTQAYKTFTIREDWCTSGKSIQKTLLTLIPYIEEKRMPPRTDNCNHEYCDTVIPLGGLE